MVGAELRGWQKRCGLRHDADAALALGISVGSYRRKCADRTGISQQTALLCTYYEVFSVHWLSIAEAAYRLAAITPLPVAPRASGIIAEVMTKVVRPTT